MTLDSVIERLQSSSAYSVNRFPAPWLKLDANENLFLPAGFMRKLLQSAALGIDTRLYPSGEAEKLKGVIAEANGFEASSVVLGGGGDQLIGLLASTIRPGEAILSLTPTFSVYPSAAQLRGIRHSEAPLAGSLKLDPGDVLKRVDAKTRLIAIVSPHNPVGVQFEEDAIKALVDGFDGPVVIDEAYVDYGKYNLNSLCRRSENLILLRTFSKAYGLAGLRVGYLLAGQRLAEALNRVQDPFPASSLSIEMALRVLRETETVRRCVEAGKTMRRWLSSQLSEIPGVEVLPSDTNFVSFCPGKPAEAIWRNLAEAGIAVRLVRGIPDRGDCLRVTVAPRKEMEGLLDALRKELQ